jgi:hypothetical protein
MFSLKAEGFFCNLEVTGIYGYLGIRQTVVFNPTLHPDLIRIGIQPKGLDPDSDPKRCSKYHATTIQY